MYKKPYGGAGRKTPCAELMYMHLHIPRIFGKM